MLIVRPDAEEEGIAAIVDMVGQTVAANGGQVTQVDLRGKRRLAYPIEKLREGHYILMQIEQGPDGITELERSLKLQEQIIRHLIVRRDKEL